jgi:hypothetical protein
MCDPWRENESRVQLLEQLIFLYLGHMELFLATRWVALVFGCRAVTTATSRSERRDAHRAVIYITVVGSTR